MARALSLLSIFCLLSLFTIQLFAQEGTNEQLPGKAIYEKHCLRCHGENGAGNGPDAAALIVPPANLQSPESRSKLDSELRSALIWGLAFSPMHGWWDKLTRKEIWAVIHYIREIAPYQSPSSEYYL